MTQSETALSSFRNEESGTEDAKGLSGAGSGSESEQVSILPSFWRHASSHVPMLLGDQAEDGRSLGSPSQSDAGELWPIDELEREPDRPENDEADVDADIDGEEDDEWEYAKAASEPDDTETSRQFMLIG